MHLGRSSFSVSMESFIDWISTKFEKLFGLNMVESLEWLCISQPRIISYRLRSMGVRDMPTNSTSRNYNNIKRTILNARKHSFSLPILLIIYMKKTCIVKEE